MNIVDKLLRWSELHARSKAVEELSLRLIDENTDLRIENIRLKREIERLAEMRGEGGGE